MIDIGYLYIHVRIAHDITLKVDQKPSNVIGHYEHGYRDIRTLHLIIQGSPCEGLSTHQGDDTWHKMLHDIYMGHMMR